ncbi:MAG: hypothetical protein ACYC9O_01665 [Candidatus Latescibacterota bacterium]
MEKFGITAMPNGWKWNDQFDAETCAVELPDVEITVLREQSKRLDRESAITRPMLSIIR